MPEHEVVAVEEKPKEIVPKIPTLPVLELTPKDVDELLPEQLGSFLMKGGCIYYVLVKKDLVRPDSTINPINRLMLQAIQAAVQAKVLLSGNTARVEYLQIVFRHIHENLTRPLEKFRQQYTDFIPEYIEFRITFGDHDDVRVHHTVRDKNGVPLGNR